MEREKDKAGLVSETFEASLGKRMVVHLRPPNHPTTFVRGHRASRSPLSDGAPPPHQPAQAQHKHKHKHKHRTSTSQVQLNSHQKPSGRETLRATLVILRQYASCFRMGLCLLIFYKRDLENQDKNHVWPSIEGFYRQGTNSGLIKSLKSSQAKGFSCQWPKVIPSKSTGYRPQRWSIFSGRWNG